MSANRRPAGKISRWIYLLVVILILLLSFFLLLPGKKPVEKEPPSLPPTDDSMGLSLSGVSYIRTEGERLTLRIAAERAEYRENPKTASLFELRARVYPRSGGEIDLFGDSGQYNLETEILSLPEGLTAATSDGLSIMAGKGSYSNQTKELGFESEISVLGRNLYLRGQRLSLNTEKGTIAVEEGIEAELAPAKIKELLKLDEESVSP